MEGLHYVRVVRRMFPFLSVTLHFHFRRQIVEVQFNCRVPSSRHIKAPVPLSFFDPRQDSRPKILGQAVVRSFAKEVFP